MYLNGMRMCRNLDLKDKCPQTNQCVIETSIYQAVQFLLKRVVIPSVMIRC